MPKSGVDVYGFLGKGVEFEGQLKFEGAFQIDGVFKGEIQSTGTLVVGEGARVDADIQCGTLIIHGDVIGNVQATNRLEALAPARITGDIHTPVLVINQGVFFEGHVQMNVSEKKGAEQKERIRIF